MPAAELEPQPQKASILLVGTAEGNELDLLTAQLDLELVTRLEVKLHRVGTAHHEIAIKLNFCVIGELPPPAALALTGRLAEADALRLQQCLIEGGEV